MNNKTYNITTIGCQMNKSDSERIVGYLEKNGYKKAERKKADLIVINTCGVRQSAEDRVYGLAHRIKRENPKAKIIISGCLSERKDVKRRLRDKVDAWIPINRISDFRFQISDLKDCNLASSKKEGDYLKIKPKYGSGISAFVPIGNGCNNYCAYCVVPYARGKEVYRSVEDILNEAESLVERGYKEVILIAQNVNSYKFLISNFQFLNKFKIQNSKFKKKILIDFSDLILLINCIPGKFWIRFSTSHPKDMSEELIKTVASCEKVCEHIHLPVQAGDDEILKKMNRGYTKKDYVKLINEIRKIIKSQITNPKLQTNSKSQIQDLKVWQPPVAITTDVIVGFPGETKKQFENTKKLFKEIKFDMAYISQYSPRPGTAAAKLEDDVPKQEKKRREEELMKVLRMTALENNKKYLGKVIEVLVEGISKDGGWYGKTRTGKVVKFRISDFECRIGEFVEVEIMEVEDFRLKGYVKGLSPNAVFGINS